MAEKVPRLPLRFDVMLWLAWRLTQLGIWLLKRAYRVRPWPLEED